MERDALLLFLDTNTVEEKPQMTEGRIWHSVAVVGNFAYVIAGEHNYQPVASVERYDVLNERWSTLPAKFDQFFIWNSSITCNSRYILNFGDYRDTNKYSDYIRVRRFDHLKPTGAWLTMCLDSSNKLCGNSYGLMHLSQTSTPKEENNILVFGGQNWNGRTNYSMAV